MAARKSSSRFSRRVLNEAIDSVVKEQKEKQPKYEEDEEEERLKLKQLRKGEDVKSAITMADIYCDPLLEEITDFLPFSAQNLKSKFLEVSRKTGDQTSKQEPRLEYSIIKGTEEVNLTTQLRNSRYITVKTEEEEDDGYETVQEIFFLSNPHMPRIAIGVNCGTNKDGKVQLKVKNIPITSINSQYYLLKAHYSLSARKNPKTKITETKEQWILAFDAAMTSDNVSKVILDSSDTIFLNFKLPEEIQTNFDNLQDAVRYNRKKIDTLTQEILNLKLKLQTHIADLQTNQKNEVMKFLIKNRFIGAVDKAAECLVNSFDEKGEFHETDGDKSYVKCMTEIKQSNDFLINLQNKINQATALEKAGTATKETSAVLAEINKGNLSFILEGVRGINIVDKLPVLLNTCGKIKNRN